MLKLVNFRCAGCDQEKEDLLGPDEIDMLEEGDINCDACGDTMVKFDFKQNNNRWYFFDGNRD